MSAFHHSLRTRGDQPIVATASALRDGKELAFVALERTRMPMVISDPRQPDNPIVLANSAFLSQTGYVAGECVGRNCRFLQGPGTEPRAVEIIREGLAAQTPVTVELLNYRKDGRSFWNQLHVSPIFNEDGELVYFFASQMDVTETRRARDFEHAEHALLREVDHRAKNALALVQGVVRMSDREHGIEAYADAVLGRVDAIALAHTLLSEARWRNVELGRLIAALGVTGARTGLAAADGPTVRLSADQVQPLAIVLNELLSEKTEYAPLLDDRIAWQVNDGRIEIDILHHGTGTYSARSPTFGAKLVEQVVKRQLRGTLASRDHEGGSMLTVSVPHQA